MKKIKHNISTKLLGAFACALTSFGITLPTVGCSSKIENKFFTIQTDNLQVTFCDKGASIYSIKYMHGEGQDAKTDWITYHPQDKKQFMRDDFYYGKTLGRVAGRIASGDLRFDEKDYKLEINEVKDQGQTQKFNSLHGGTNGFGSKYFKRSFVERDDDYTVSYNYFSPAYESGYPEAVYTCINYTISKLAPRIDLDITATPTGRTPLDITNHPFFRLGNSGDIKNHVLTLPEKSQIAIYDNMATEKKEGGQLVIGLEEPTGVYAPWDFTEAKEIDANLEAAKEFDPVSGGYDHIWKFPDGNETNKITLANKETNIKLDVTTDANAVIMYANCYPNAGLKINNGELDKEYAAITIEPYDFFVSDLTPEEDPAHEYIIANNGRLLYSPEHPFKRHISYSLSEINE